MIDSAQFSNSRLTLTRLANDSLIKGRLWMTVGKRVRKKSPFTIASNSLIHVDLAFGRAEEALVSEILLLPFVNIHYPIILQMVSNQDDKQKRHYYKAKLDNSSQSSSVSIHRHEYNNDDKQQDDHYDTHSIQSQSQHQEDNDDIVSPREVVICLPYKMQEIINCYWMNDNIRLVPYSHLHMIITVG